MCIASIPTVFNPELAPKGKALVHAYCAANESYSHWEGLDRKTDEYKRLKVTLLTEIPAALVCNLIHFVCRTLPIASASLKTYASPTPQM